MRSSSTLSRMFRFLNSAFSRDRLRDAITTVILVRRQLNSSDNEFLSIDEIRAAWAGNKLEDFLDCFGRGKKISAAKIEDHIKLLSVLVLVDWDRLNDWSYLMEILLDEVYSDNNMPLHDLSFLDGEWHNSFTLAQSRCCPITIKEGDYIEVGIYLLPLFRTSKDSRPQWLGQGVSGRVAVFEIALGYYIDNNGVCNHEVSGPQITNQPASLTK